MSNALTQAVENVCEEFFDALDPRVFANGPTKLLVHALWERFYAKMHDQIARLELYENWYKQFIWDAWADATK